MDDDKTLSKIRRKIRGYEIPGLPGWEALIEPLIEETLRLNGEIHQIKEKFGGLRFYYSLPPSVDPAFAKRLREAVDNAEAASFALCENCGAAGALGGSGWMKTYCAECRRSFDEQRAKASENTGEDHGGSP